MSIQEERAMRGILFVITRVCLVLVSVVVLVSAGVTPRVSALAGAHSYTNTTSGDVFLGGDYIELGLSKLGSFGTANGQPKPSGFYGTSARNNIGMSTNPAGFGEDPDLRMDFFMPGSPEERWAIGYKESGTPVTASNSLLGGGSDISNNTVTNESTGSKLQARSVGTYNDKLKTTQVVSFNRDEKFFKNEVTLQNVGATPLDSVRYLRSFDPDNTVDQNGDFSTRNYIPFTHEAGDGKAVVVADTSNNSNDPVFEANGSRSPILFYSSDSRARVSTYGFSNKNPYDPNAYDSALPKDTSVNADQAITIAFDVGTLAAGSSETFVYYTSLDNRDFDEVLSDITAQEAGPNNGDGNGDSIPDNTQPNVEYVANTVAGEGKYVTLETTGCDTISSLGIKKSTEYGSDGKYVYPLGLVDFSATCAAPGSTSTVRLYYDQKYDTTNWIARKYLSGTFATVPGAVFGTATVGPQTVTTLTYQITDGGALDADGVANGVIVDPAGPAVLGTAVATAPATGYGAPHRLSPVVLVVAAGAIVSTGTGLSLLYRQHKAGRA